MLDDTKEKTPRAGNLIAFVVVFLSLIGGLAVVCQSGEHTWTHGHDQYRLLPIKEWNFRSGYWDGIDGHGQGTGGRIYQYGFIERVTNRP